MCPLYFLHAAPLLFAKGSVGAYPDTVYGLALCRGDANASTCGECVGAAFASARQSCASNWDATVFYDMCLLRYSNQDLTDSYYSNYNYSPAEIVNTMDTVGPEPMLPGWDDSSSNPADITETIQKLLRETSRAAATVYYSTKRYATGFMDATANIPPLYSMAQCTPDLTPSDCSNCFEDILGAGIVKFTGRQTGVVLALACSLRYDTTLFYSGMPMWRIKPPGDVAPAVGGPNLKHKRRLSKYLVIAIVVPLLISVFCFIISFGFIRRHRKGKGSQDEAKINVKEDEALVWGLEGRSSEFMVYDFTQVLEATCNFSEKNKLGQGGFGPVYKGLFADGLEIAVKRLASRSVQGFTEFKNEIQLIAKLQHTNLVRLLGCCSQGEEKILIYEYLPNKSLNFFIFDPSRKYLINWTKRLAIIEGIAQGMLYLHKLSRLRVIHRDLKTSNILLDRKMNPKISDFGLAKIFSTNDSEGNTERIAGTYGYMAPEYASEGIFSIKSDVFSFGVIILEIVSGKRTSNFHRHGDYINLLGHAWQLWKDGQWLQLVGAWLIAEHHIVEMMRCINIALLCVQENAVDRPTMSLVVAMLSSESMTLPEPKHPAYFNVRVTKDEESRVVEPSSPNDVTLSALDGR